MADENTTSDPVPTRRSKVYGARPAFTAAGSTRDPEVYPAVRYHANPECTCVPCQRERLLLAASVGAPHPVPEPDMMPRAPSFRELAAKMHGTEPFTTEEVEKATARIKEFQAAGRRGVKNVDIEPALLGARDLDVVANFVACAQKALLDGMANGRYPIGDPDAANELYLRIAALTDFERYFLIPASRAMDADDDAARMMISLLEELFWLR